MTTTTSKATKATNYTQAQTLQAVEAYQSGTTTEAIATLLGKSTRSIIAKLSREGVYAKKEYKTKSGEAVIAKEAYVVLIADALEVDATKLGGLEKANKATLDLILKALTA
jgi:hypothetical protein